MGKEYKYRISVVVPVFNEAESISELIPRILSTAEKMGTFEIIFVNDGSSDGTATILDEMSLKYPGALKIVHLRKNFGKSVALQVGFNEASGKFIIMMDGDLQDKPEEIPKLMNTLEEKGLDAVTGRKVNRQDPFSKTIPSKYFNWMMRRFSGLKIHDFNCGLKAFRHETLLGFTLYGQLHRFILIFIAQSGFRVGEVEVEHAPRRFGFSKYGYKRIYHGFMDLLTVFFITRYLESPLYFFGISGVFAILASIPIGLYFLAMHFLSFALDNPRMHLAEHPLWLIAPILFILGMIMIFFGLIGELLTYHLVSHDRHQLYIYKKTGFAPVKGKTETDPA